MNIKHIIFAATLLIGSLAAAAQERFFPYPQPPEELTTLMERTNYLVERFWERCNVVTAINEREKFTTAFNDYVSFMPYADAEVVHKSIDNLLDRYKKDQDKLIPLAEIAQRCLYDPTAEVVSDEIFLRFAQAAASAKGKKIDSAKKKHFARLASILSQSQVDMKAPDFEFTKPDGTKDRLSAHHGRYSLILFDDPDNTDCFMARVRLQADPNVSDLIDKGILTVFCISPTKYTTEWAQSKATYNSRWITGAAPAVADMYDMRNPPVFYYLNGNQKILSKTFTVDGLMEAFRRVNATYNTDNSKLPSAPLPEGSTLQIPEEQ